jgi:hypothetical protein
MPPKRKARKQNRRRRPAPAGVDICPADSKENADDLDNIINNYHDQITRDPTSFFSAVDELIDELRKLNQLIQTLSKKMKEDLAKKITWGLKEHLILDFHPKFDKERLDKLICFLLFCSPEELVYPFREYISKLHDIPIKTEQESKVLAVTLRLISNLLIKAKYTDYIAMLRLDLLSLINEWNMGKTLYPSVFESLQEDVKKQSADTQLQERRNGARDFLNKSENSLVRIISMIFYSITELFNDAVIFDRVVDIIVNILPDIPVDFLAKPIKEKRGYVSIADSLLDITNAMLGIMQDRLHYAITDSIVKFIDHSGNILKSIETINDFDIGKLISLFEIISRNMLELEYNNQTKENKIGISENIKVHFSSINLVVLLLSKFSEELFRRTEKITDKFLYGFSCFVELHNKHFPPPDKILKIIERNTSDMFFCDLYWRSDGQHMVRWSPLTNVAARSLHKLIANNFRGRADEAVSILLTWLPRFFLKPDRIDILAKKPIHRYSKRELFSTADWLLLTLASVAQYAPWFAFEWGVKLHVEVSGKSVEPPRFKICLMGTKRDDNMEPLARTTLRYLLKLTLGDNYNNNMANDDALYNDIMALMGQNLLADKLFQTEYKGSTIASQVAGQLMQDMLITPTDAGSRLQTYLIPLLTHVEDEKVSETFKTQLRLHHCAILQGLINDESALPTDCLQLIAVYQQLSSDPDIHETFLPVLAQLPAHKLIRASDDSLSVLRWSQDILEKIPSSHSWRVIELGMPLFAKVAKLQEKPHPVIKLPSVDEKSEEESIVSFDETFVKYLMRHFINLRGALNNISEDEDDGKLVAYLTEVFQALLTPALFTQVVNHENQEMRLAEVLVQRMFSHFSQEPKQIISQLKNFFEPLVKKYITEASFARELSLKFESQGGEFFNQFIKCRDTGLSDWFELSKVYSPLVISSCSVIPGTGTKKHRARIAELFKSDQWFDILLGSIDNSNASIVNLWLSPQAHHLRIGFCQGINLSETIASQNNDISSKKAIVIAARQAVFLCYIDAENSIIRDRSEYFNRFFTGNTDDVNCLFSNDFFDVAREFSSELLKRPTGSDILEKFKELTDDVGKNDCLQRSKSRLFKPAPVAGGIFSNKRRAAPGSTFGASAATEPSGNSAAPNAVAANSTSQKPLSGKGKQAAPAGMLRPLPFMNQQRKPPRLFATPAPSSAVKSNLSLELKITDWSDINIRELKSDDEILEKLRDIKDDIKALECYFFRSGDVHFHLLCRPQIRFYYLLMIFEIVERYAEISNQPGQEQEGEDWPYYVLLAKLKVLRYNVIHNLDFLLNHAVVDSIDYYLETLCKELDSTPETVELTTVLDALQKKSPEIIDDLALSKGRLVDEEVYKKLEDLVSIVKSNLEVFEQYPDPALRFVNANVLLFNVSECYEWLKAIREFEPRDKLPENLQKFTTLQDNFWSELKELRNNFAHVNSLIGSLKSGSSVSPKFERIVRGLSELFLDLVPNDETVEAPLPSNSMSAP